MTDGVAACPVCLSDVSTPAYAGLRRCTDCTHLWADLALDWSDLQRLYQHSYFFGEEYNDYLADRRIIEKNFARRLQTLSRFMDASHTRLLEVGCAYGLFLNLARPRFQMVQGVDISEEAVAYAVGELGLNAVAGDVREVPLASGEFDVACMWDTIEHLAEPRNYVAAIADRLRPGGLVAVTTGDVGSLVARIQRARWRLIHPPSHLQYFTRRSMTTLLDRAGFRVRHIESCGFSRSVRSMVHNVVALRWHRASAAAMLSALVPSGLDLYLNLHDIMYVIAERR